MTLFEKITFSYLKFRHAFSPILFTLGFLLDLKVVKQPDATNTIIFISTHFVLTTILILLNSIAANKDMDQSSKNWNPTVKVLLEIMLQFTFGALASSLFVLYFKGSDYVASLPILIILATFLFGNEFAQRHTGRFEVRFVSTVILAYIYLIYLVPLLRNQLGNISLLISTGASIIFALILIVLFRKVAPVLFAHSKTVLMYSMFGLFVGLPLLVYLDVLPPLPLILREGTVAHSVIKEHGTEYKLAVEDAPLYERLGIPFLSPVYKVEKGGDLYFFTAVYAPSEIKTDIIHVWSEYDPDARDFIERSKINLKVSGGRELGFRTYSMISSVEPGLWRVTAKLGTGQILGHRDFRVENGSPILIESIK